MIRYAALSMAFSVILCVTHTAAHAADIPADALELPPAMSQADQQAAQLARSGNGAALQSLADQWVRSTPGSANAWFYHGLGAELSGRPAWAVDDYQRALRLAPEQGASAFGLGRVLFAMDKDAAAVEPLRRASLAYPNNNRVWADYGLALGTVGRFQDAAAALQRSVNLAPNNGYHAGELADAYASLKLYSRAIPLYVQASRKTPADEANIIWLGNLGQVYELAGDYRASIQTLQQALRFTPNDADIWACLWVDYLKTGDAANAARAQAMLARLTRPAARSNNSSMSRAAANVMAIAKQQHEAYLHNTGKLNLNEHLP